MMKLTEADVRQLKSAQESLRSASMLIERDFVDYHNLVSAREQAWQAARTLTELFGRLAERLDAARKK